MALVSCSDCNREISDSAPSCPGCGAPRRKPARSKAILLIPVAIVGALVGVIIQHQNNPAAQARARERSAIDLCWREQARPSLAPDEARFIAQTCEGMESQYRIKHGREP